MSDSTPPRLAREFWLVLSMSTDGKTIVAGYPFLTEAEAVTWQGNHDPEGKSTQIRKQEGYPPPNLQPLCQCKGNPMAQMFCMYGHMTECHAGLTCEQAECGHYARYEEE